MNDTLRSAIDTVQARSAWMRGVKAYAHDLLDALEDRPVTMENLLNGASSWREWAYGGCGQVYDADIAERLCAPWELKRNDHGRLPPNANESWLEVEARAACQAAHRLLRLSRTH